MPGSTINSRMSLFGLQTLRCKLPLSLLLDTHGVHSYYKSLSFYLQEQPMLLNDLLTVLTLQIEHTRVSRVVRMF